MCADEYVVSLRSQCITTNERSRDAPQCLLLCVGCKPLKRFTVDYSSLALPYTLSPYCVQLETYYPFNCFERAVNVRSYGETLLLCSGPKPFRRCESFGFTPTSVVCSRTSGVCYIVVR